MSSPWITPASASASRRSPARCAICSPQRWLLTQETHDKENPKRVYYLSMEFLIGRTLVNNIINLGVEQFVRDDLQSDPRQDWTEVIETEPDAGLGNGGLGRLAACFIDSLATLQIPAMGYGLRYEYGIFRQAIENGFQVEHPDHWLAQPDPWEVARPRETVQVPLGCSLSAGERRAARRPRPPHALARRALRPPGGRLWRPDDQHAAAVGSGLARLLRLRRVQLGRLRRRDRATGSLAETVTRVLYPDDSTVGRPGAAFRPGVLPGVLLAGRHRGPLPPHQRRLASSCPTRWPSSSTTRTRRWPWPS